MTREVTFENALAFAGDLIRIPSMSGEEGEVASRLQEEMRVLGFDQVEVDGLGSVAGGREGQGRRAPGDALLPPGTSWPRAPTTSGNIPPSAAPWRTAACTGAGRWTSRVPWRSRSTRQRRWRGRAPGDVIVGQVVYEERGGWGMENLVRSGLVNPAAVIIGESTFGDIALGHRGRAQLEVVIRGEAGHASAPDRARNALALLPGVLDGVARLAGRQDSDPVLGPASLAPTDVTVRPESPNVIPDEVTVVLDWRILPTDTAASLIARVEAAIAEELPDVPAGYAIECRLASERQTAYTGRATARSLLTPGFLMEPDHPVVTAAARAVGRRDDPAASAHCRPWTFATDGGWTCGVFGIPTIGFAPERSATRTPTANVSTWTRPAGPSAAIRR